METEVYLEIIESGDKIKIEPLHWAYEIAEDDWDKNWIWSRITVKGGAFNGKFECYLFSTDFELFKRELKKAYNNLSLAARFKTIEEQVDITFKGDGIGHFEVNCIIIDKPGIGNRLELKMNTDQTIIPSLVNQLEKITNLFPIRGSDIKLNNE